MAAVYDVVDEETGLIIYGSVIKDIAGGWRFYPRFQGKPSRRAWPTPTQAIGRRVPVSWKFA